MISDCLRSRKNSASRFVLALRSVVPIREFTDSSGVRWRVWSTIPGYAMPIDSDLRDGWLSFDSGTERRRVSPIPKAWDQMPAERLDLLCRVAATTRRSDPKGVAIIRGDDFGDDAE